MGYPTLGVYSATKFAVEGLCEALASEVAGFGIRVTIVEPNGYDTDFSGTSLVQGESLPAYNSLKTTLGEAVNDFGSPAATVPAVLQLIASDNPPKRFFLGRVGYPTIQHVYADRLPVGPPGRKCPWPPTARPPHGVLKKTWLLPNRFAVTLP